MDCLRGRMRTFLGISLCFSIMPGYIAGVSLADAQNTGAPEPQAVKLSSAESHLSEHKLGGDTAIHLSAEEYRAVQMGQSYIEFEITVSENGRVEKAQLSGGIRAHAEEAQSIEMERRFKPWTQDGAPIRVIVSDYVLLLPPEQWAEARVPFPDKWSLQGASVRLTRTSCYGTCPAYEVTVDGDGTVRFSGHRYVLIPGDHVAHIAPDAVKELIRDFQNADFFSARDGYAANWTDNPTQTLTLIVAGRTKTVTDYVGIDAGMPLSIRSLEKTVDDVAGTERWIKGDDSTIAALEDERWPFAAANKENLTLYNTAILTRNQSLIERYLAASAPIASPDQKQDSPVCVASQAGDLKLVERMMSPIKTRNLAGSTASKKPGLPSDVIGQCLLGASRSGNLELLEYWLDKGADPTVQPVKTEDWTSGLSVLANGIISGNVAVVQKLLEYKVDVHASISLGGSVPILIFALERGGKQAAEIAEALIAAGADVNARGYADETPIFAAHYAPDAVKAILAAGADLDARNKNGDTALIRYAFSEGMVKELLADGADPTLKNNRGETALTAAKQFQSTCPGCVTLIEQALKKLGVATAIVEPVP